SFRILTPSFRSTRLFPYTTLFRSMEGHAIEARIYAEDPKTFFPSPGHITTFDLPEAGYIRHETTVTSNYQVTPFYDPMISKLIVDRKSTRLNSSHVSISYAVFCLK